MLDPRISPDEAELLLDIAEATLATALRGRPPALPRLGELPDRLHEHVGAFVTLTVADQLNGCIGDVEGTEPLAHSVARLALSAAFADPRLPALEPTQFDDLAIELSLLSPLSPIAAGSRSELLDRLRPLHDGLVVRSGERTAVFLPAVWRQRADPGAFVDQLWHKAGLPPGAWPPDIEALRFSTESHGRTIRDRISSGRA